MASALKSQFGSSTSALDAPVSQPKGHGILHNLLEDAVTTAKGIPFGIEQTVEHPIKSVKLMGKSYADTYGHGWGNFLHSFHEHPLQPLLDAISVPLILAGGAGFAVKGASAAADIGRAAELGDAWAQGMDKVSALTKAGDYAGAEEARASLSRNPTLYKQAQRFKKGTLATTRFIDTPLDGVSLPYAYSSNLFRRAMTKGADMILEGVGNKYGIRPLSTEGKGARMLEKELSTRKAATASRAMGQARVLYGAKKAKLDPHEVAAALNEDFEHTFMQNAIKVDAKHAEKLAQNPLFKQEWEFVYADPTSESVDATVEHPYEGPVAPPGTKMLTTGSTPVKYGHDFKSEWTHKVKMGQDGYATNDHTLGGYEGQQMQDFIHTLGERIKTGNTVSKAHVDENGMVTIARKGAKTAYQDDIAGTAKLAEQIYKRPLKMWKFFILAGAPRYFVNNVIGNAGMYAAATNPVEFTRGILSAVKRMHGDAAARDMETQMTSTLEKLMNRHLPNEWISQNMGYLQHGAMGVEQTAGMGLRSPFSRQARSGLYEVTEKASYRGPQRASLTGAMVTDGDFRDLYRHYKGQGMKDSVAFQKAANEIVRNPIKQAALEKRVTDWAGQYYHLNPLEKMITAFVPFYNWDRHALRFGKESVLSRPVRTATLASLGGLGDKQASKELGKLPDFMKGAIPIGSHTGGIAGLLFGQRIAGRQKVILSAGYNPLAAAADDAHALAALIGARNPEEVAGQLNPVVSGAVAGITGQNMFSGARVPRGLHIGGKQIVGGILGTAAQQTFGELPQAKLLEAEFGKGAPTKTKQGDPTLYTHNVRQQLSSLFGLNERDYSPKAAAKLYRTEHGIKKGRRKSKKQATAFVSSLKSNL